MDIPKKPVPILGQPKMSPASQIAAVLVANFNKLMTSNPGIAWADILGGVEGFRMEVISQFMADRGFAQRELADAGSPGSN